MLCHAECAFGRNDDVDKYPNIYQRQRCFECVSKGFISPAWLHCAARVIV
jgi:hypothetical protein